MTRPTETGSLTSVGLVAGWVVDDTAGAYLEHSHLMAFEHLAQFGAVLVEQLRGFELMASQEDVPSESELTTSASRLGIVSNKHRSPIIGVGSDCVIVDATETGIDNAPAFMAVATE